MPDIINSPSVTLKRRHIFPIFPRYPFHDVHHKHFLQTNLLSCLQCLLKQIFSLYNQGLHSTSVVCIKSFVGTVYYFVFLCFLYTMSNIYSGFIHVCRYHCVVLHLELSRVIIFDFPYIVFHFCQSSCLDGINWLLSDCFFLNTIFSVVPYNQLVF